ncbi:hypothetical protein Bca4012_026980 [Brassica carinata]
MVFAGGQRSVAEEGEGVRIVPELPGESSSAAQLMEPAVRVCRGEDRSGEHSVASRETLVSSDADDDGPVGHLEHDSHVARSGSDEGSPSDSEADDRPSRRVAPVIKRMTPFRCNCDGTSEELYDLDPKFDRSHQADGQDWGDVNPTHSTLEGVSLLMEKSRASVGHPNTFGPWDAFRRDLPKLVALRLQRWRDFDRKRIRRQQRRIGRVDWESYIPCEKTKGKRLKLPLMGTFSNVYPGYAKILSAQLGDTSFGSVANAGEKNSVVVDALVDQAPEPASAAASPNNGGPVDAPSSKKKRKRVKSSSKTRTDPSLGGDERDVTRSPRGSRGDDEMEGDREGSHSVSSESPTRGLSSGGGVPGSSGTASQTASRTLTTVEISGLSFTDQLSALARAEAEVATCKDNLVAGYEAALRKATFDLEKTKEEIRSKEAELKVVKREKLDGAKELEAARSRIAQLEEEKFEDSEKTRRVMDRMRQSRNRKLLSERKCMVAAAERLFEKFRKYMADRDRKEEKHFLHGTALGTLDAVTMLETRGLPVPRELKDLLTTNEETFRNEAEEVTVEVIIECDLVFSPGRSASAVAPRSPIFGSVAPLVAQVSNVVRQPTTALGGDLAGALDRPFGTVSGPPYRDDVTDEVGVSDQEEAGTTETGGASLSDPSTEA